MTKLQGKPFALIGVNGNRYDPPKLKQATEKNNLNWRSFADDAERITAAWNNPGTPGYYVIDHKGIIRHKFIGFPGPEKFDGAIEALLKEAGGDLARAGPSSGTP